MKPRVFKHRCARPWACRYYGPQWIAINAYGDVRYVESWKEAVDIALNVLPAS